jgi:hypothetical protein
MADTIWGEVQTILGNDTFEMLVTREGDGNAGTYGPLERVRIGALTDPGAGVVPNPDRRRLQDKNVRCAILGRQSNDTLIAEVTIL